MKINILKNKASMIKMKIIFHKTILRNQDFEFFLCYKCRLTLKILSVGHNV